MKENDIRFEVILTMSEQKSIRLLLDQGYSMEAIFEKFYAEKSAIKISFVANFEQRS